MAHEVLCLSFMLRQQRLGTVFVALPVAFFALIPCATAQANQLVWIEGSQGKQVWVDESASFADRVFAELGGGLVGDLGAIGVGIGSGALGWAATPSPKPADFAAGNCDGDGWCTEDENAVLGGLLGLGMGTVALVPAGVTIGGNAAGGDGSYWSALGGSLVGSGLSAMLTVAAVGSGDEWTGYLSVGSWLLLPMAGSIIGYELSVSDPSANHRDLSDGTFTIGPNASLTPNFETGEVETLTFGVAGTL